MWWALAAGVAVLVAPGALVAVSRVGTRPAAEAETMRPVRPEVGAGARPAPAGGAPTTTAAVGATTGAPSGSAGATAGGGGGGRCDPYCSDLSNLPPPPPVTYDPFAGCPHRWQVDPATGQRIDTGCASDSGPPVPVVVVTTTAPPTVLLPEQPTTTTTVAPPPPPTTPPTTAGAALP